MGGTNYLWPYSMRMANDAINEAPNLKDKEGRSPLQIFSNTSVLGTIWMSGLCLEQSVTNWKRNPKQVGVSIQSGHISWTISKPWSKCGVGP